jgi:hypothetical protein
MYYTFSYYPRLCAPKTWTCCSSCRFWRKNPLWFSRKIHSPSLNLFRCFPFFCSFAPMNHCVKNSSGNPICICSKRTLQPGSGHKASCFSVLKSDGWGEGDFYFYFYLFIYFALSRVELGFYLVRPVKETLIGLQMRPSTCQQIILPLYIYPMLVAATRLFE